MNRGIVSVAPPSPHAELLLVRSAEALWHEVMRPWIEAGRNRLERAYILVPTRGQAQGWKQRCLDENIPLLGVEFLTPGLARRKWRAAALSDPPSAGREPALRPAMGRELLLLGLHQAIARRQAALTPVDDGWGYWQSLSSDAERALDDFDDLLKAGFSAEDFPQPALREVFGDLMRWVERCGYTHAAIEARNAGLKKVGADGQTIGDRGLVVGMSLELAGEFFGVAAFLRRIPRICVALPDPEFGLLGESEEGWINVWQDLLGVEARPVDEGNSLVPSAERVGALWTDSDGGGDAGCAAVLVGQTRTDEMRLVADRISDWVRAGARQIAVMFPRSDSAHLRLVELLVERGVSFVDLLETAGPPPVDNRAQQAVLEFYARGGRIEELMQLWPILRAVGSVTLASGDVRVAIERAFDQQPTHALAAHVDRWLAREPELARVAHALGDCWPEELTLADALQRFRTTCEELDLAAPEGIEALDALAARDAEPYARDAVIAGLASFVAVAEPVPGAPGRGGFARVVLGTRRRLEGVSWSHVALVESNAGCWPVADRRSCWLTDEERAKLNQRGRFSFGLVTASSRRALEKRAWGRVARDTSDQMLFSAARFEEESPDVALAPNAWLERVLWSGGVVEAHGGIVATMASLARETATKAIARDGELARWIQVNSDRRDPARPFDVHFLGSEPGSPLRPEKLSPRLIERSVGDPAELWFDAVVGVRRVPREPLVRNPRKALGLKAHALLADALKPAGSAGRGFGPLPSEREATDRLESRLLHVRRSWPRDHFWASFGDELERVCQGLLNNIFAMNAGEFVATEAWLDEPAELALAHRSIPVIGRMDLVRSDRPGWQGATVDVVDFKTGGDAQLSAKRMGRTGASLQLGVYLAAINALGVQQARVWMLKPEPGDMTHLDAAELPEALRRLQWLDDAIERGVYGALTPDRSPYAPIGFRWPLACVLPPAAVLREKFDRTFSLNTEDGA